MIIPDKDTLCVYCGTDLEKRDALVEVVKATKAIRPALEADHIGKTLASCTDPLCDFGLCVALRELDAALKKLEGK